MHQQKTKKTKQIFIVKSLLFVFLHLFRHMCQNLTCCSLPEELSLFQKSIHHLKNKESKNMLKIFQIFLTSLSFQSKNN